MIELFIGLITYAFAAVNDIFDYPAKVSFLYWILIALLSWQQKYVFAAFLAISASVFPLLAAFIAGADSINTSVLLSLPLRMTTFLVGIYIIHRVHTKLEFESRNADEDSLTGILNVRGFYEHLFRELEISKRHGELLSLINFDLDNFKQLNDTRGHDAGDQLLIDVGVVMKDVVRPSDIPARLGGDEFTIILPRTDSSEAESVASRILQDVVNLNLASENGVSASVGIITIGKFDLDPRLLVKKADDAMYSAKKGGKNQIVITTYPE